MLEFVRLMSIWYGIQININSVRFISDLFGFRSDLGYLIPGSVRVWVVSFSSSQLGQIYI